MFMPPLMRRERGPARFGWLAGQGLLPGFVTRAAEYFKRNLITQRNQRTLRTTPGGSSIPGEGNARYRPNPQNHIQLFRGEWPVTHRHRAEHFRIERDLVECDAIWDAKIEILPHRAHLHRPADSRNPWPHEHTTRPRAPA